MNWSQVELQDIALQEKGAIVSGPFGSNISAKYFVDEGIPVIRGNNLTKGKAKFIDDGFAYLTETKAAEFRNCMAMTDDIVFTAAGSIGQVGIIPPEARYEKYVISNKQLRVRLDKSKANPNFVFAWLSSPRMVRYLENMNNGGAVPLLNLGIIRRVPVPLPPIETQDKIADILSAYDDLIENNRLRIALLEEAARLLYREWFVHFRFPGHEHVKIIDGLPEGWERLALSDLADFVNGYPFKPAHLGDAGLPIVKIPELKHGVTEKTPRNPGDLIPEKYHLKDGDLIFSWSGTLAANVWASGPALLNQHLFHVIPRNRVGRGFLMCALQEALTVFNNQTVGATMKHIRRSALDRVFVALPDRAKMSMVEDKLQNTYAQLIVLYQQNQKLAQARDLLLPRLMNGEITV